jgi:hypothetical protein
MPLKGVGEGLNQFFLHGASPGLILFLVMRLRTSVVAQSVSRSLPTEESSFNCRQIVDSSRPLMFSRCLMRHQQSWGLVLFVSGTTASMTEKNHCRSTSSQMERICVDSKSLMLLMRKTLALFGLGHGFFEKELAHS